MQNDIALKLSNVSKIYPGVIALSNINLNIKKGEVHGLIGKNGAGKSTLVNIISGVDYPTEGTLYVGNVKYKQMTRMLAQEKGISIITQDAELIPEFSVAEILFSPNLPQNKGLIDWKIINSKAQRIMDGTKFNVDVTMKARDLSVSFQKFVLLIKAFYVDDSSVVILDEMSASISQKDQEVLFDIIREAKNKGKTILYITHRMDEIKKICDRVTVIRDGKSIATEECKTLSGKKLASYIIGSGKYSGNDSISKENKLDFLKKDALFSVNKITSVGKFDRVSFGIRKGEILGLAGLRGSGRTEILKAIFGIDKIDSGTIELEGKILNIKTPWDAKNAGIVYLTENRDVEGLFQNHTVKSNLLISILDKFIDTVLISRKKEGDEADKLISMVKIKANANQEVQTLSGGNRQKVVIGRVISTDPKVLLLDEPTKGIDIDASNSILKFIKEDLSKRMAIVMTSPGLGDLINICDRILVISSGKIVGEFYSDEFNEGKIFSIM